MLCRERLQKHTAFACLGREWAFFLEAALPSPCLSSQNNVSNSFKLGKVAFRYNCLLLWANVNLETVQTGEVLKSLILHPLRCIWRAPVCTALFCVLNVSVFRNTAGHNRMQESFVLFSEFLFFTNVPLFWNSSKSWREPFLFMHWASSHGRWSWEAGQCAKTTAGCVSQFVNQTYNSLKEKLFFQLSPPEHKFEGSKTQSQI